MADTVRTYSALQTLLADNTSRAISPQDLRDMLASVIGVCAYASKSSNYTLTASDEVVLVDATGGAVTLTLPAVASTRVGKTYTMKKTDSSGNGAIFDGNASEQVEGANTLSITTQNNAVTIINTGSAWAAIAKYS